MFTSLCVLPQRLSVCLDLSVSLSLSYDLLSHDLQTVKDIIAKDKTGLLVKCVDGGSRTVLHYVCALGNFSTVNFLINRGWDLGAGMSVR